MGALARHIQRLERMALPPTGGPRVIRLIDSLQAADDPLQASVGPHRLDQAASESAAEFERRALAVAAEAGVEFVVINASAPWSR
jgi:hypothetical protein